jgi:hypothetical protein
MHADLSCRTCTHIYLFVISHHVDTAGFCKARLKPYNICTVYKNTVEVYGHNLGKDNGAHVYLNVALKAVEASLAMVSTMGVERIEVMKKLSGERVVPPNDAATMSDFSLGAVIGLTASIVALVIGVIALFIIVRMEARARRSFYPTKSTRRSSCCERIMRRWPNRFVQTESTTLGDDTTITRDQLVGDGLERIRDRRMPVSSRYEDEHMSDYDHQMKMGSLYVMPLSDYEKEFYNSDGHYNDNDDDDDAGGVKHYSDPVYFGRNII